MIELQFKHAFEHLDFDVDLTIPKRGITALFGRSGAGKSTIANVLAGLMTPQKGKVVVAGDCVFDSQQQINLPVWKRNYGVVFQEHRLFPHLNVEQNLLFSRTSSQQDLNDIVELLGLKPLLKHKPSQLSGGEKQRVAIGRCLLSQPQLIIMDEPLSALDLPRRNELLRYLRKLHHAVDVPIVYITHSLSEIVQLADHMVVIDEGRVVTQGEPSQVMASKALSQWSGVQSQSSLLTGTVADTSNEFGYTQIVLNSECGVWVRQDSLQAKQLARVRIDATNVSIALTQPQQTSVRNVMPATVESFTIEQGQALVKLVVAQQSLWVQISDWAASDLGLCEGLDVFAQVKALSVEPDDVANLES